MCNRDMKSELLQNTKRNRDETKSNEDKQEIERVKRKGDTVSSP